VGKKFAQGKKIKKKFVQGKKFKRNIHTRAEKKNTWGQKKIVQDENPPSPITFLMVDP